MIGVVLWSDRDERKAVFWCEDQGDLAYFDGTAAALDGPCSLSAGDMVEFDMRIEGDMRLARDARLIQQAARADLPERLRATARLDAPCDNGRNVVPFAPKPANESVLRRVRRG